MLNITTLPLGYLQTNCYILQGTEGCLVIDPATEADTILDTIGDTPLTAILLTHGHFDHVGAVRDLVAETGCRVFLCPEELSMPRSLTAGELYYTDTYADGDEITLAGLTFTVLHTPENESIPAPSCPVGAELHCLSRTRRIDYLRRGKAV